MSESLLDQIIEKAEYHGIYIEKDGDLITTRYDKCAAIENAHLMPIIKGQAQVIRMLMDVLDPFLQHSPRDTCALMAEGEGSNPETYKLMANNAMAKMDLARAKAERMLKELAK